MFMNKLQLLYWCDHWHRLKNWLQCCHRNNYSFSTQYPSSAAISTDQQKLLCLFMVAHVCVCVCECVCICVCLCDNKKVQLLTIVMLLPFNKSLSSFVTLLPSDVLSLLFKQDNICLKKIPDLIKVTK